ncbi:RNA 2',3'-cyclic phosphodiesterase [Candidatus Woesearchaeota archaeon]|jgi:RNA 2',3'-cyclic 3'-phosphodiesterase|nr:RNA 2',3'-cyclic phosphodiesterase [Candidatus Woesearchaeota archaeon]
MRVFVSVSLPTEVKDELYMIQGLISPSLAKIKWVPKKNIHLTLKFLGEVDNIDDIHKKLSKVEFNSFYLKLMEFEMLPKGKYTNKPYVARLWINIKPFENIIKLQQGVDAELFSGYQKFSPHITLGRVKMIKKNKEFLDVVKKIKIKPIEFKINSFQLMQSKLSKDGSKYIVLKKYKS